MGALRRVRELSEAIGLGRGGRGAKRLAACCRELAVHRGLQGGALYLPLAPPDGGGREGIPHTSVLNQT
jgi:hypothetical protein